MLFITYILFIVGLCSLGIAASKKWFIYLDQSLSTIIQQSGSDVVDHVTNLSFQSGRLWTWCNLPATSDIDANNTLDWAPCGSVQYATMLMRDRVMWRIHVNYNFYIEISFHVFDIHASEVDCFDSSMAIYGKFISQKFCGNRKPWSEFVDYRRVFILVQQKDVFRNIKLSFTYCILDPLEMSENVLASRVNVVALEHKLYQRLSDTHTTEHLFAVIWYVHGQIGKVITVSSPLDHSLDSVLIYRGFGKHHPAHKTVYRNRNVHIIRYYAASIYLQKNLSNYKMLYLLTFLYANMTRQTPSLARTRVHNLGDIYYSLFSIQSGHGSFPNISFQVRKFAGWHDGGCTYGGFLFKQYIHVNESKVKQYRFGPYCTDNDPNHPLIGTHGLEYLVFGESEVELIIYANGPLYAIDMDIVVSKSSCEGVVSPTLLCSFSEKSMGKKFLLKFPGYSVSCIAEKIIRTVTMTLFNISRCVLFQSIYNKSLFELIFEVTAGIDFSMITKIAKNFLLPHQSNSYNYWQLTYKQEGTGVESVPLNKTSVVTKHHVSSMSFITSSSSRMYYTYSLYVVPRSNNLSCVNIKMETHSISSTIIDLQYMAKITSSCGTGLYRDSGKYLFIYIVHSSISQIFFVQFTTLSCESDNLTKDVIVSCPNAATCYAIDVLGNYFRSHSTLQSASYRYEKNSMCTVFIIDYNFTPYSVLATMSPYEQLTFYVCIKPLHAS